MILNTGEMRLYTGAVIVHELVKVLEESSFVQVRGDVAVDHRKHFVVKLTVRVGARQGELPVLEQEAIA